MKNFRLDFNSRILISVALVVLAFVVIYSAFDVPIASSFGAEETYISAEFDVTQTTGDDSTSAVATSNKSNFSNSAKTSVVNGCVNINTAGLSELENLEGIGQTKAQAIIDYRNENGKFNSIDEIKEVNGIGDKTFEKIKDKIEV